MHYTIREMREDELNALESLLYEAIFQQESSNLLPKDIIKTPELSVYIDDFGKKDDYCLVAELDGLIIGAVWVRILAGDIKGYGNIDGQTPEFLISLFKEYRNLGIGTALMKRMIAALKKRGYAQASLSVNKANYAARMYQKLGFEIVAERDEDYLMRLKLS